MNRFFFKLAVNLVVVLLFILSFIALAGCGGSKKDRADRNPATSTGIDRARICAGGNPAYGRKQKR